MANIKLQEMGSSVTFPYALGLKDGATVSVPWIQALALKGQVYHAYVGSASTPVTLDASYANTDPDISLDVPDGVAIMPLVIRAVVEVYGTNLLFETFSLCTKTLAASSAGTVFTPINMALRGSGGSRCACYVGPTVTNGNTTGAFEIGRNVQELIASTATGDDDSFQHRNVYEWKATDYGFAPILHGEASLQTWVVSQAAAGYIQYWWAEFTEGDVTY